MLTHRFWIRAGLGLALLSLAWSLWLVVTANRLQSQVSRGARQIRELVALEETVRSLEHVLPKRNELVAQDQWQPLHDNFRKQLAVVASNDADTGEIGEFLMLVSAAIDRMETQYARLTEAKPGSPQMDAAESEFRRQQKQAVDAVKGAVRAERSRLTPLSQEMASKWRFLNGLAMFSGVLVAGLVIILGLYHRNLSRRILAEKQSLQLAEQLQLRVVELQDALLSVKQLQGLLPICAWCKKIRDDQDYWHEVEAYVAKHTEARFTHGICPNCFERKRQARNEIIQANAGSTKPAKLNACLPTAISPPSMPAMPIISSRTF